MKRGFHTLILVIALLIISGCSTDNNISENRYETAKNISDISTQSSSQDTSTAIEDNVKITVEELSKHNSSRDCWVTYKGKVYDLSGFIPNHPGGDKVLISKCGKVNDFEEAFVAKHGTSKIDVFFKVTKEKGVLEQNA